MEDEEYLADPSWLGDQAELDLSQPLQFIEEDIQADGLAVVTMPVDAADGVAAVAESQQENCEVIEASTEQNIPTQTVAGTGQLTESPPVKAKTKRNTVRFAMNMIKVNADIFLDSKHTDKFNDRSVMLTGQIMQCAREANGKNFSIHWFDPLPPGLKREWLRTLVPGTKGNRNLLIEGLAAHNNSKAQRKKAPSEIASKKKMKGSKQHKTTNVPTPNPTTNEVPFQSPVPRTVTVVGAAAGAASIRTSSTISSLSRSTFSSPQLPRHEEFPTPVAGAPNVGSRLGTRSNSDIESVSKDGSELDEEDNMYNPETVNGDSDYDGDDDNEDDPDEGSATSPQGLAELLQAIRWNFCVQVDKVKDNDALPEYNGPTGLKPRVASSFDDPFRCLEVCGGITYEFVARLARIQMTMHASTCHQTLVN
jgi:hypothetical protein